MNITNSIKLLINLLNTGLLCAADVSRSIRIIDEYGYEIVGWPGDGSHNEIVFKSSANLFGFQKHVTTYSIDMAFAGFPTKRSHHDVSLSECWKSYVDSQTFQCILNQ